MVKNAILALALLVAVAWGGQRILFESAGAVVQVKEKYGCSFIDTVTQIEIDHGQYVLYDKNDRPVGWYPVSNHSITIIERLKK